MENKECISCDLEQKTGIDVSYCYQCGKCTAGCVLSEEMDYAPSYILRLLQTKNAQNDRRVLSSNAIWICKKSVNNGFITCIIGKVIQHKPDKRWLHQKKLKSIAGIAYHVIS